MIFFDDWKIASYMYKSSAGIKLYVFIIVVNLSFSQFTLVYLQPLGEGGALFLIEGASNKVTINASWVFYYWGLYGTSIVFSYNAKSSAGFLTSLK